MRRFHPKPGLTPIVHFLNWSSLANEREELKSHKERWEADLNTVEENQPELLARALYRRDHYARILGTIDQGLAVISILSAGRSPEVTA